MSSGHTPAVKRTKSKPPSAAAVAASAAQEHIERLTARWEIKALSKGTNDPSAHLQAVKILKQLVDYLVNHRSTCKQGTIRALLQKEVPAELLVTLLSSNEQELVAVGLQVLLQLGYTAPAAVPPEIIPRLLQLLRDSTHGACAAKVLTVQMPHWRLGHIWPCWLDSDSVKSVYQQLQRLQALCMKTVLLSSDTAMTKAIDGCVSFLTLLVKLMLLAEAQLLQQLAPSADVASRWLELVVQVGQQHRRLAGSHAFVQVQGNCCALIAGMAKVPATSLALSSSNQLRQQTLQLLHTVLHRPCCVSEADSSHVECWSHAASAASLPVFWQQHPNSHLVQHADTAGMLPAREAREEEEQLLTDLAISAAATMCNECFSAGRVAKLVDAAAARLLAAALLPHEGAFGSQQRCISRFMAPVLSSNCCHVLLHALATSTNTSSEQTAQLAAAASAAARKAAVLMTTCSAALASAAPSYPDGTATNAGPSLPDVPAGFLLAPVEQELQPGWLLLRLISSQCALAFTPVEGIPTTGTRSKALPFGVLEHAGSRSSNGRNSSNCGPESNQPGQQQAARLYTACSSAFVVQPEQVLQVLRAYALPVNTGSEPQPVLGLLQGLHFLLCQAALVRSCDTHAQLGMVEGQRQQQQHQAQRLLQESRMHQPTSSNGSHLGLGSSSSCSDVGRSQTAAEGQQLLVTAGAMLHHIIPSNPGADMSPSLPPAATAAAPAGPLVQQPSSGSMQRVSWSITASAYIVLAVAIYLQEHCQRGHLSVSSAAAVSDRTSSASEIDTAGQHLQPADTYLALTAMQLAAAALKLLLPALAAQSSHDAWPARDQHIPATTDSVQQQSASRLCHVLPVYDVMSCSLAAAQALGMLSSMVQRALPGFVSGCISSTTGHIRQLSALQSSYCHRGQTSSSTALHTVNVPVSAAVSSLGATATALDPALSKLLEQVVLTADAHAACNSSSSQCLCKSNGKGHCTQMSPTEIPVSASWALQHDLQQDLRCWCAASLASCFGQLGARSPQGVALQQSTASDAPFTDVKLHVGSREHTISAHAGVLAAGCAVLGRQLAQAASAQAADTSGEEVSVSRDTGTSAQAGARNGCRSGRDSLHLKMSIAVDPVALRQALTYIYTGASDVPYAGLASQLRPCHSSLSTCAVLGTGREPLRRDISMQQRVLQSLLQQQAAAKQQLHKLGMLARKLQLPLLAALTRSCLPRPGQVLQEMHAGFGSLLPQPVVMFAADDRCSMQQPAQDDAPRPQQHSDSHQRYSANTQAASAADSTKRDQGTAVHTADVPAVPTQVPIRHVQQPGASKWAHDPTATPQPHRCSAHLSSDSYLLLLETAAATEHAARVQVDLALQGQLSASNTGLFNSHNHPDVLLAAPVLDGHLWGSNCLIHHLVAQQQECQQGLQLGEQQQHQQDQLDEQHKQVVWGYLPAHRVLLSARCPYFEALLSQRWHGHLQDTLQSQQSGTNGSNEQYIASNNSHDTQQLHAHAKMPVVLVPEADIHVAAALQQYLYTGILHVQLPDNMQLLPCPQPAAGGCYGGGEQTPHLQPSAASAGFLDHDSCSAASGGLHQATDERHCVSLVGRASSPLQLGSAGGAVALSYTEGGARSSDVSNASAVQLPQQAAQQPAVTSTPASVTSMASPAADANWNGLSVTHEAALSSSSSSSLNCHTPGPKVASSGARVDLHGCCQRCHVARTLLRLWRCAELLLLPDLQGLCLSGVADTAGHLAPRCCLVLLADCCQLGVPDAVEGLVAAATCADKERVVTEPEWDVLPAGLQSMIIRAWAQKRLQQEGSTDSLASGPAVPVLTSRPMPSSSGPHPAAAETCTALPTPASTQRTVQQAQQPCQDVPCGGAGRGTRGPQQATGASWQHVQELQQAAQSVHSAIKLLVRSCKD